MDWRDCLPLWGPQKSSTGGGVSTEGGKCVYVCARCVCVTAIAEVPNQTNSET